MPGGVVGWSGNSKSWRQQRRKGRERGKGRVAKGGEEGEEREGRGEEIESIE